MNHHDGFVDVLILRKDNEVFDYNNDLLNKINHSLHRNIKIYSNSLLQLMKTTTDLARESLRIFKCCIKTEVYRDIHFFIFPLQKQTVETRKSRFNEIPFVRTPINVPGKCMKKVINNAMTAAKSGELSFKWLIVL